MNEKPETWTQLVMNIICNTPRGDLRYETLARWSFVLAKKLDDLKILTSEFPPALSQERAERFAEEELE